jgi:hypothetical protein
MDTTGRQATNVESGKVIGGGPMNTFKHVRQFPPADFRDVVRPNFDTLYSIAWLDLTREPMVVTALDTQGRYYLLGMLEKRLDTTPFHAILAYRIFAEVIADFGRAFATIC